MKKTLLTRVSLMILILLALFIMTSSVWAVADTNEPIEKPSQKADPVKEEKDCRVCYPIGIWKMLDCTCKRQPK
jgi:hypothetical protein